MPRYVYPYGNSPDSGIECWTAPEVLEQRLIARMGSFILLLPFYGDEVAPILHDEVLLHSEELVIWDGADLVGYMAAS